MTAVVGDGGDGDWIHQYCHYSFLPEDDLSEKVDDHCLRKDDAQTWSWTVALERQTCLSSDRAVEALDHLMVTVKYRIIVIL